MDRTDYAALLKNAVGFLVV